MTDRDLLSQAEELLRDVLIVARTAHDPTIVNAHAKACRAGSRILALRIGVCAHRIELTAWSQARPGQAEDSGVFQLIAIAERVDGED